MHHQLMTALIISICIMGATRDILAWSSCQNLFTDVIEPKNVTHKSKTYTLFSSIVNRQEFAKNYSQQLALITAGDSIEMPSGQTHKIFGVLGQGQQSIIFDLGDGWVLRLPLIADQQNGFDSIRGYYELQKELSTNGIPVVHMDLARSERPHGGMLISAM